MAYTIYGYCRISTKKQSIDRQIRNIKAEYPTAVIIPEAFTGTKMDRPKWNNLQEKLKPGDTVVFDEVSRMSRNANEGFQTYKTLYDKGVNLIFLKETTLNTENFRTTQQIATVGNEIADIYIEATNKALMILAETQIKKAFEQAQKEVDYLHQRTKEGLETARINGKQIGQKKGGKLITKKSIKAKEQIKKYNNSFNGSLTNEDTWKLIGISKTTFYKYKEELLAELQS